MFFFVSIWRPISSLFVILIFAVILVFILTLDQHSWDQRCLYGNVSHFFDLVLKTTTTKTNRKTTKERHQTPRREKQSPDKENWCIMGIAVAYWLVSGVGGLCLRRIWLFSLLFAVVGSWSNISINIHNNNNNNHFHKTNRQHYSRIYSLKLI